MKASWWMVGAVVGLAGLVAGVLLIPNKGTAEPEQKKDEPPVKKDEFAGDRVTAEVKAVPFDGKRAMGYLKDLCDIGTRVSATEGMKTQQELLKKHFEKHGATVEFQPFKAKQRSRKEAVEMANMIVSFDPKAPRRVILCGHYDTRPMAHEEPDPRNWSKPFLSANDGTSTVAFLMEMAHHMKDLPRKIGVDFVLFDGEEYIFEPGTRREPADRFFFGSEYFAGQYAKAKKKPQYAGAILLDLFAGEKATFKLEGFSRVMAKPLINDIWVIAKELGVEEFVNEDAEDVMDDHSGARTRSPRSRPLT